METGVVICDTATGRTVSGNGRKVNIIVIVWANEMVLRRLASERVQWEGGYKDREYSWSTVVRSKDAVSGDDGRSKWIFYCP